MPARHLVLGLDGADLELVRALGPDRLPSLHALMREGAYAALESVTPPATLPNWTTLLTGLDPGAHGVFDFTTKSGYAVRFTAGTVREAPTIAARLDRLGLRCACVGFPATFPPERLSRGVFVSGWDAPVAFEADRSFVWPPALWDELRSRFGGLVFDDVDELAAARPGWHAALPAALVGRIERRTQLLEHLLGDGAWDVFMAYFGESDTASHHLWALHDPASPRHPAATTAGDRDGLARVYVALDAAVGRLRAAAGDGVEVTIVSDHGSGGASDKVLYLNRALEEAGLLRFSRRSLSHGLVTAAKDAALVRLPPRLRERIFRAAGAVLPGLVESRARFGAIDMGRTVAFSDELNYFPAVWLNVRGREPRGRIEPTDLPRVRREVIAALLALRDPWTGGQVVVRVHERDALYDGPFVARAPDLILELALAEGYSYNLVPTGQAPAGTGPFRRLGVDEHLGRKGRSLPGSHRPRGLLVAAGPRVAPIGAVDAKIADVTATLLARLDVAVPGDFAGRVLWECLEETAGTRTRGLPPAPVRPRSEPGGSLRGGDGEGLVEQRLRALGYVE